MQYVLRVNNQEEIVESLEMLKKRLEDLRHQKNFDVDLTQKVKSMKGFEKFIYKMLGLSSDIIGNSVYVMGNNGICCLVFLDKDYREYRVINPEYEIEENAQLEFLLATGERSFHPKSECISIDVAFKAVYFFFEHGKRPGWLKYKKEKSLKSIA